MSHIQTRDNLRQIYQKTDTSNKTFIPAKPKANIYGAEHIYRVCAYCRVSTDNDEQLSSFELQQNHYKQLANEHPNWDLRHIYADEGISGKQIKHRKQFQQMMQDAKLKKFDKVVVKDVSRFARNTVDLLQSVRELKDGTGFKLTTAQYFTPNGDYINGKGIKPTIEEKDEAKQLDIAVEWIKEQINK